MVRAALQEVCGPQEAQHGFGWAEGEHNICFYTDDERIVGQDPIWVQTELTAMVRIFERSGLQTNMGKTKAMICTPGFIWGQQGAEAYKRRATGEGPNFRERVKNRVSWEVCGGEMDSSYLLHHMERLHGRVLPQLGGVEDGGVVLEVYKLLFLRIPNSVECPVEGCPSRGEILGRLTEHFMFRHWKSKVDILQEVPEPLPWCDQCGMHMQAARLFKHRQSEKFHESTDRRLLKRGVEMAERCG